MTKIRLRNLRLSRRVRRALTRLMLGGAFAFSTANQIALADIITYQFQGTGSGAAPFGSAFDFEAVVDSSTGTVQTFSYSWAGFGTWTGTGGTATFTDPGSGTRDFLIDTDETFTSISNGFTPTTGQVLVRGFSSGVFGGFIDGLPTNFAAGAFASGSTFLGNSNSTAFATVTSGGVSTVPEPTSAAVLATGLGLAALRRRRKERRQGA